MSILERNRKSLFKLYLIGFLVSLSLGFLAVLLPVYLRWLGASYFELGLFGAISGIPNITLPIIIGTLSDRFGRKIPFLFGLLMATLMAGLLVFASSVFEIILIGVIWGIVFAVLMPVANALISDLSVLDERTKTLGYYFFSWSMGMFLGPFLGGFIVERYSFTVLFLSSMSSAAASFLFTLFYLNNKHEKRRTITNNEVAIQSQHGKWSGLIIIYIIFFIFSTVFSVATILLPAYMDSLEFNPANIGILFAFFGIARAFTSLQAGRISKYGDRKPIILGLLCTSIATLLISFFTGFYQFIIVMLVLGFGLGILGPVSISLVSKSIDENRVGSALGANESIFGFGWMIGPFIGGVMAQSTLGPTSPYLMVGLLSVLMLIPTTLSVKPKLGKGHL